MIRRTGEGLPAGWPLICELCHAPCIELHVCSEHAATPRPIWICQPCEAVVDLAVIRRDRSGLGELRAAAVEGGRDLAGALAAIDRVLVRLTAIQGI